MSTKDDGGPAFPSIAPEFDGISSEGQERWINGPAGGMTLRDYFAGQALSGWYSGTQMVPARAHLNAYASEFYAMADALLEARK